MKYTVEELKEDVLELIAICQEDLLAISSGVKRQASKEQIEGTIIPEMKKILVLIDINSIPEKSQRWVESAALITRGWNWDIWSADKLNHKLPELDRKYRHDLE